MGCNDAYNPSRDLCQQRRGALGTRSTGCEVCTAPTSRVFPDSPKYMHFTAAKCLKQQLMHLQIRAQPEACRQKEGRATGKPCVTRATGESMRCEHDADAAPMQSDSTDGPRGTDLPLLWPFF